jgi:hypothetical protein
MQTGYALTTRFIKASTLHPRALHGNPWCFLSIGLTAALQVCAVADACLCAGVICLSLQQLSSAREP